MKHSLFSLIPLVLVAVLASSMVDAVAGNSEVKRTATIAPLGDSRTAIIHFDNTHLNATVLSHLNWANALDQQKFPYTGNFGISGASSDVIIEKMLEPALASHPAYMTILMGVNDVRVPGFSAEHTMANIAKAANRAIEQGIAPIVFTDPGSERYNAEQVAFINDVNSRIKAFCTTTPKAVLFDMAALLSAKREPSISFHSGWSYDGIHLQTLGSYNVGLAFAKLMDSLGAVAPEYPGSSGNMMKNSSFAGTAGEVGAENSGTLPDSFVGCRDNANCSAAFSVAERPDGNREIIATVKASSPNTLGGMRISQALPLDGFSQGDDVQAGVQVEIEKGSVNLADVRAEVTFVFTDGSFAIAYCFNNTFKRDTISSIPAPSGLSLTLQSPTNRIPKDKGIKSITFRLGSRISGEGSAVLRFRNPWCKKVQAYPLENPTSAADWVR